MQLPLGGTSFFLLYCQNTGNGFIGYRGMRAAIVCIARLGGTLFTASIPADHLFKPQAPKDWEGCAVNFHHPVALSIFNDGSKSIA